MRNRSTVTSLIQVLQLWHEALNSSPKMDIHAVFIDFTLAFDTIDHCLLLHSIEELHVRRPLWLIVRSYLDNREQKVKWGSCVSNSFPVQAGVPGGHVISRVSTFKLLGVIISSDLSWDAHIPDFEGAPQNSLSLCRKKRRSSLRCFSANIFYIYTAIFGVCKPSMGWST